jgi:hypothetical protein
MLPINCLTQETEGPTPVNQTYILTGLDPVASTFYPKNLFFDNPSLLLLIYHILRPGLLLAVDLKY